MPLMGASTHGRQEPTLGPGGKTKTEMRAQILKRASIDFDADIEEAVFLHSARVCVSGRFLTAG